MTLQKMQLKMYLVLQEIACFMQHFDGQSNTTKLFGP
jgi:hypothetical protein